MKNRTILFITAFLVFALTPLLAEATQIAPNPNPAGSTIDIINDPFAVNNENPFTNEGIISINSASTLTNSVGAKLDTTGAEATLNNAGTVNNSGSIWGGTITNTGTLNNFAGASLLAFGPSTLTNAVGGTINNYGGMGALFGGRITNAGALNNFAGASLTLNVSGGNMTNTGTLNNFAGASISFSDNALTNAVGAVVNNSGSVLAVGLSNQGSLNNSGSLTTAHQNFNSVGATVTNAGQWQFFALHNAGTVLNTGSVTGLGGASLISNSGTVINTGSMDIPRYVQSAGTTINNGTITASSTSNPIDIQGGSLRGTGTMNGAVTLGGGATLSPGDSTSGKFTINGNLQSSGNLLFRIGGLNAGQFDVLAIHGHAFFNGGTVGFNFFGFTPLVGHSWDFLYAESLAGWESLNFFFSGLGVGQTHEFSYANGVQTLRIVSVPEPSSLLLMLVALSGLGFCCWVRNRQVT